MYEQGKFLKDWLTIPGILLAEISACSHLHPWITYPHPAQRNCKTNVRSGMHNSTCKILTQDNLSQQSQASGSWEETWRAASQPRKSFDCYGDCATPVCHTVRLSTVASLSVLRSYIPHCRKTLLPSWSCFSLLKLNFILYCCIPLLQ